MGLKVNHKIAGLCVASCFVLAAPLGTSANTYSDLVHNKQSISNQKQSVQSDLDKVNQQIHDLTKNVSNKQIEIGQNKAKVNVLNKSIAKTKKHIKERQELFKKRLNTVYKHGDVSTSSLEILFDSKNFGDFINRAVALHKLNDQDQQIIKEQKDDQDLLKKQQTEVQDRLNQSEKALSDLQNDVEKIQSLQATKQAALATLDQKEDTINSSIADVKAQAKVKAQKEQEQKAEQAKELAETTTSNSSTATASSSQPASHQASSASVHVQPTQQKQMSYIPSSAATGSIGKLISVGNRFIGNSTYVWGAENPGAHQFDCSGFVNWAYNQIGVSLGARSTSGLQFVGKQVSTPQPGDLIFFFGGNSHVGIVIGGGKFIGSQSSTGVAIESYTSGYWKNEVSQFRRVLN